MTAIKAITYAESREAFFAKKLKQAERALDNVVKYGTDPDACAEKGEIVSFYQDVLSALRERPERSRGCDWCIGFCPDVLSAPTIDAVEVRRGEWILKNDGAYGRRRAYCSICEKHSGIGGIVTNQTKPYCPNCGADMRGSEDA